LSGLSAIISLFEHYPHGFRPTGETGKMGSFSIIHFILFPLNIFLERAKEINNAILMLDKL